MRDEHGVIERSEPLRVANEFTSVDVCLAQTPAGARLEVRNSKTGEAILLDAIQLESLTTQDPGVFSELLRRRMESEEPH